MPVIDTAYDSQHGSITVSIPVRLFTPAAAVANQRGVVVAYGAAGLDAPFGALIDDDYCKVLAAAGFVVARPDYFAMTGTAHNVEAVMLAIGTGAAAKWVTALVDAVKWIQQEPLGVSPGRVGLVGFSLGANQALQAAIRIRQSGGGTLINAAVDFFGPINALPGVVIPQPHLAHLPPTQIHHGRLDNFPRGVPFKQGEYLDQELTAQGVDVDFNPYPAQGHPGQFTETDQLAKNWSTTTHTFATNRSIQFLKDRL